MRGYDECGSDVMCGEACGGRAGESKKVKAMGIDVFIRAVLAGLRVAIV